MLGESDLVLAGGIESMSRMPYLIDAVDARWGHRRGELHTWSTRCIATASSARSQLIMGETAELLAQQCGITREQSDGFALESQRKAKAAIDAGHPHARLRRSPCRPSRNAAAAPAVIDRDEHPRDTTIESLRRLPAVFGEVDGHPGIITAGTSSGITDGGAALVLASAETARARGSRRGPASSGERAPASTRASWASARSRRSRSCAGGPGSASTRLRPGRAERGVRAAAGPAATCRSRRIG